MDPPLAKAKLISDGGSTSGITRLRKGKSCCTTSIAAGERTENMCEKQLCGDQDQWRRRGRRCSRRRSRDFPAAHGAAHGECRLYSCSPWRSKVEHISPCSPGRTPCWSRWRRWGSCDPVGSPTLEQAPARTCGPVDRGAHAGAGLLAWLVTPWGNHTVAACSWRAALHGKYPRWRTLWRAAGCGEDSHWRISWRTVSHGRDLMLGQGKSVRSPGEEGAAKTTYDKLTATPIPHPPVLLRGRR